VFNLRTSPFYLLGVSPRDNRAIVAQATETAIAEGTLDEAIATRAQQILMSPRLRLGAELSWLTGLAPNRVRQLIEGVELDTVTVASLPLLAGANLAAHRCSSRSSPSHHDLFLRFYARRDDNEILNLINSERRAGGFPEVSLELLQEVMADITQQHASSFIHLISSEPSPGDTLLSILKEYYNDGSNVIGFLDDIAERFEVWAAGSFQQAEEAITGVLTKIQETPTILHEQLPIFSKAIRVWGSVAAPYQFMLSRRHINDPRTDELFAKIRGVCLRLNNELDNPRTSLALTKAALPAFEASPGHLDIIKTDMKILEERVFDHDTFKLVEPLQNFVKSLQSRHDDLCRSLRTGNFRKDGKGVAGDLFRLFEICATELTNTPARSAPFKVILSLAIDLHNESNASNEAFILISALQKFHGLPSDDQVVERLKTNGLTVYRIILQKKLASAAQANSFNQSVKLAKELEEAANDDDERDGWHKVRLNFEHKRRVRRCAYGAVAGIIGIIVLGSASDNRSTGSPPYPKTTPGTSASAPTTTSDPTSVSIPASGSGAVLSAPEIRWCLLESDRLKRIRQLAGESPSTAIANAWNARHEDWNGRCANKNYYKTDYDVAERFALASAATLQSEALALYSAWAQTSAQSTAPVSPPPLASNPVRKKTR
jgi:hypothetical protein